MYHQNLYNYTWIRILHLFSHSSRSFILPFSFTHSANRAAENSSIHPFEHTYVHYICMLRKMINWMSFKILFIFYNVLHSPFMDFRKLTYVALILTQPHFPITRWHNNVWVINQFLFISIAQNSANEWVSLWFPSEESQFRFHFWIWWGWVDCFMFDR